MSGTGAAGAERRAAGHTRDERYRQLVELAPDAILIHDGARIVLANSAAVRLAGATHREQLVGQRVEAFLDPPYLKAVQTQLLGSGELANVVTPVRDAFRRLDGTHVPVDVTAMVFLDHARFSAHLVIRDVTTEIALQQATRLAEDRLHQAQKLDTVGALAGGVAHEVNNMMLVIIGLGEFLLRDPALPSDGVRDVRQIMESAAHAATVTRQLLSFSRRAFHLPRVLDLSATVRDLEPVVRRLLGETRQVVLTTDAEVAIWADPGQVEQLVVNLALNSRDAMPDGGTLAITVLDAQVAEGLFAADGTPIPTGRYALLVARDTGDGMDAETLARIFEPFFTTKPMGAGTGLGLAAVYGIIVQNKGYVAVSSAPGHGATFSLYFPVASDSPAVAERREIPPPDGDTGGGGRTVLVVDDEPAVLAVAVRALEYGGFHVLQASDGAGALEVVDRHGPPDLVLTDLMMRGLSGAELARRLNGPFPSMPILFMSGYSLDDLRREGVTGVEGLLMQKPFTPAGLLASVTAALARPKGLRRTS